MMRLFKSRKKKLVKEICLPQKILFDHRWLLICAFSKCLSDMPLLRTVWNKKGHEKNLRDCMNILQNMLGSRLSVSYMWVRRRLLNHLVSWSKKQSQNLKIDLRKRNNTAKILLV